MKKFITLLILFAIFISLFGCGNENWGVGNYTFTHAHFTDGVKSQCVAIDSWHDNEIGCEIHTPNGTIYLSEGCYQLFEQSKTCPYCKGE